MKKIIILLTLLCVGFSPKSQTSCPDVVGLHDIYIIPDGNSYKSCREYILHQEVTFHIQPLLGNIGEFVYIDFGDGNGMNWIYLSQVTVNYSTIGTKEIKIKITNLDFESRHYSLPLTINQTYGSYISPDEVWDISVDPSVTWAPPCSDAFEPGSPFLGSEIGTANAYIKYATGRSELVRPLVFVDGLDFGSKTITDPALNNQPIRNGGTGWDIFIRGSSETFYDPDDYSEFRRYPGQFNDILNASYDIIFLDFKNGSDYIQKNALLLQELITQINDLKVVDPDTGIKHGNVIVGASMGGQIAKYTLAKMEADGIPHCSNDYISFDSPHQGANITMGLQAAAWYFNRTSDNKSLWEDLNTPAARQLLIQNFGGEIQNGNYATFNTIIGGDDVAPPNPSLDFNCLMNDFVQIMESYGYPIQTRNTAISCGSETAINQGYNGNAHLYKGVLFINTLGTVFNLDIWANQSLNYYHIVKEAECSLGSASITKHIIDQSNSIFAAETPSETDDCSDALAGAHAPAWCPPLKSTFLRKPIPK